MSSNKVKLIAVAAGIGLVASLLGLGLYVRRHDTNAEIKQERVLQVEKKERKESFGDFKLQPDAQKPATRAVDSGTKSAGPVDSIIAKVHQIFTDEKLKCGMVPLGEQGSEARQQYLQELFAQPTDEMTSVFGEISRLADTATPEQIDPLVEEIKQLSGKKDRWTKAKDTAEFGAEVAKMSAAPDPACMRLHFEVPRFLDGAIGAANRAALREQKE